MKSLKAATEAATRPRIRDFSSSLRATNFLAVSIFLLRCSTVGMPVHFSPSPDAGVRGHLDYAYGSDSAATWLGGRMFVNLAYVSFSVGIADAQGRDLSWGAAGAVHLLRGAQERFSLSVEAGHAEGVLVVDGDLELSSGAVVEGLVMTSGRLLVRDSSRLHGVALVGGLDVAPTATVLGSLCAASVALAAAREELGRALPLPGPRSLLPG